MSSSLQVRFMETCGHAVAHLLLSGNTLLSGFSPPGTDVVYDPEIAASLVKLLSTILRCSAEVPQVLICSTIRNPETYSGFKQQLGKTPLRGGRRLC